MPASIDLGKGHCRTVTGQVHLITKFSATELAHPLMFTYWIRCQYPSAAHDTPCSTSADSVWLPDRIQYQ